MSDFERVAKAQEDWLAWSERTLQRAERAETERDEAVALLRRLYDASFGDPEYELGDTAAFLARIEEARE